MAKILCIDDYKLYSEMVGMMLEKKGRHNVKSDILPFDMEDIRSFNPDVIVLSLVRKTEALGAPLHDFFTEVDGAKAFRAITENPDLLRYPIVITGIAIRESEIPKGLEYLAFLEVPARLDYLLEVIDRITRTGASTSRRH